MTNYIPQKQIGTVIVLIKKGKVLLGKRKNSYMSGSYGLPGGKVDNFEKLADCANRELLEETGLKAKSLEYLGVVRDQQNGYSFTHFAFLCKKFDGVPKLKEPKKCEGWKWFGLKKVPPKTLIAHKAAIDMSTKKGVVNLRDVSSV